MNSLPKTVTRQRRRCDLNPGPSAPESSTLTTRLPSLVGQFQYRCGLKSPLSHALRIPSNHVQARRRPQYRTQITYRNAPEEDRSHEVIYLIVFKSVWLRKLSLNSFIFLKLCTAVWQYNLEFGSKTLKLAILYTASDVAPSCGHFLHRKTTSGFPIPLLVPKSRISNEI